MYYLHIVIQFGLISSSSTMQMVW